MRSSLVQWFKTLTLVQRVPGSNLGRALRFCSIVASDLWGRCSGWEIHYSQSQFRSGYRLNACTFYIGHHVRIVWWTLNDLLRLNKKKNGWLLQIMTTLFEIMLEYQLWAFLVLQLPHDKCLMYSNHSLGRSRQTRSRTAFLYDNSQY